jgi:hypothetical protein
MTRTVVQRIGAVALAFAPFGVPAGAAEPCGDFGECKALVEINATDGDIGFHFLMDGDDLRSARILDARRKTIFVEKTKGALRKQTITETFGESAEPLCWEDPEADPDEEIVTLEEFLARWPAGTFTFLGQKEKARGATAFTHELPAAPAGIAFDGSVISWTAGDDLGRCASEAELDDLVAEGVLPVHPAAVPVAAWEITLEPDVADGDPIGNLVFTIRVAGDVAPRQVTVPADYLASLPDDTPAKIEVGAIGVTDNATFTEVVDLCLNPVQGCD